VFAECPVSPITDPFEYEKIKVLRCLLLKEKRPDLWALLLTLESHTDTRKENFVAVSNAIAIYKFIQQECHMTHLDFETINHVAGICAINAFCKGPLASSHYRNRYAIRNNRLG